MSDEGTLGSSGEEERYLMAIMTSALASRPTGSLARPESMLFMPGDVDGAEGTVGDRMMFGNLVFGLKYANYLYM